mmetsp:Transcript_42101/g.101548  ORF Transcript_42101/g.101548 Transcript_42101/m.101548 type:complete len:88 (+) Transcript_42101:39-302(+)
MDHINSRISPSSERFLHRVVFLPPRYGMMATGSSNCSSSKQVPTGPLRLVTINQMVQTGTNKPTVGYLPPGSNATTHTPMLSLLPRT